MLIGAPKPLKSAAGLPISVAGKFNNRCNSAMYGKPPSLRNLLWPIIIGAIFGIWILTSGSDWMLSLLGFVPALLFTAMFTWAVVSERRI